MNIQRFVLPATLAAAFHAALLYGSRDGIVICPITFPPVFKCHLEKPVEIIEQPVVEDEVIPEVVPMPKGAPRPENEEMYREVREATFIVNPIQSHSRHVVDPGKIEPLGVPEGVGTDVMKGDFRQRIVSSTVLDKEPRAKVQMPPDYPPTMKKDGLNGTVIVEFDVDMKGRVVGARVRESTDRAFEEPTLRAVLKWRFEPGLSKGLPVPFRMVIPVKFNLGAD